MAISNMFFRVLFNVDRWIYLNHMDVDFYVNAAKFYSF